MKVARGLVPTDGAAPGGVAGAAGQQRKGARILAAETFAHHEPLPGYLDHIPRRQALATCLLPKPDPTRDHNTCISHTVIPPLSSFHPCPLSTPVLFPPLSSFHPCPLSTPVLFPPLSSFHPCPLSTPVLFPPLSSFHPCPLSTPVLFPPLSSFHPCPLSTPVLFPPLSSFHPCPLSTPVLFPPLSSFHPCPLSTPVLFPPLSSFHPCPLSTPVLFPPLSSFHPCPLSPLPTSPPSSPACGRTTVTIRSQYLGPYDLHNDIYNMTFYNGCAYNVTSPLRVWQCFNFGNVWEGILDNPDPNPSQYQQGEIFVQTTPGYCEMRMNRGASGTLQMLPGETVNIVYAYLWDFRPCVQELRFGNGNSYSMTNTTECQLAAVI
ncbi:unnamed protein product [Closterium sp. Naga37s-1]|nr:unnamed protein product [Closterium sp. Naga37s-1]